MVRVRCVKDEAFEIEFAHTAQFRPRLEVHIGIVADAVIAFEKSDFGIEIGPHLPMLRETFEPAVLIIEPRAYIGLSGRKPRCSCLRSVPGEHKILMEDQASICTARLVETVERIPGTFIDSHYSNVGTAPQRAFHACDCVVRVRVWAGTSGLHAHRAQFKTVD